MLTFLRVRELVEYESNNPYDVVYDVLALNFIKQALDEKYLCRVAKATTSNEAWKFLEAKFGTRGSDMQHQGMSQAKKLAADLRVDEKDSEKKTELGETHSKVDDSCQNHKIETHYASMHMDEEDTTKIVEREAGAFVCETEQEQINALGLHYNMDDIDGVESHCDQTHVDEDCKVICELVIPTVADGFGEVEIVNEINNDNMHVQISHHIVDEHYVGVMCGFFFEIGICCGKMVSLMFDETMKVDVATVPTRYKTVGTAHEAVCHLGEVDDQEHDKVIEEFLMRICTNDITVEDNLHAIEKKGYVEQQALTEESHIKDDFNIVF